MLRLICAEVRQQLSAFHDEALSVEEQIAIAGHLDDCPGCAVEAEDLRVIRDGLRGAAAAIHSGWSSEVSGLQSVVIGRLRAEDDEALLSRAGRLFDDPRRVWTTGGAVVLSTLGAICLVGVLLVETANEHPKSLSAIVRAMAHAAQVRANGPVVLPRVNPDAVMPAVAMSQREGDDVVSAFTAVVTQDGDLANVELLQAENKAGVEAPNGRLTDDLLAAAATARFEPARIAGAPVAVNVIWLLTHTTVRGKLLAGKATRAGWSPSRSVPASRFPRAHT